MSIRIICIGKSGGYHADPHHAIQRLGFLDEGTGNTDIWNRLEMYDWIKTGGVAYVRDARDNTAYVRTREHAKGTKYLQTCAGRVWTDNLLALTECL